MTYIISAIIGYLLGSVNPAYFFGKMHGFDIRTRGTCNAGASNAKVLLGWKYFVMVVIYDVSKAALSMFIAHLLFPDNWNAEVLAGAMAVLGHCFPFYLQFKGGKGFASLIGLVLMVDLKTYVIIMVIALILALLTNYIVTATVITATSFPVYMFMMHASVLALVFALVVSGVILWKHRVNAVKLMRKEEIGINGKMIGWNILNKEQKAS